MESNTYVPIWGGELDGRLFTPDEHTMDLFPGPDGWYEFHGDSGDYRFNQNCSEHPAYLSQLQWMHVRSQVISILNPAHKGM